jgi:DNA-binding XRE family transcriptional regulator
MKYEIINKEGHSYAVIPLEIYEKLVEDSEMLADIQAYDNAKALHEESFPLDVIEKIILGVESPVKIWREYRNLTQEKLAETVGISSVDLADIEKGTQTASVKTLQAIATVLEIDLETIIPSN